MPTRRPPRHALRALTCAATLAATVTGCGAAAGPPPPSTPAVSVSSATALELANFAVEFVYRQFLTVITLIDQQPPSRWRGMLAAVTAEPELSRQLHTAADRTARGVRLYGEPEPHITAIRGALTTTATLEDCQDTSHTGQRDPDGTEHPEPRRRHITATLSRTTTITNWKVTAIVLEPTRC
jgi:hypothetical protein